ncbi:MAG: aminoglycoside phosphotransferase family protein [Clostridium sp.]|uniref:aminoglycoside phosphotransferase family protein n=1 Tax=Clostridium sp. TaxID=1506 RepID=UPI003D6D59D0
MENRISDNSFIDIPSYSEWISIEQINKGWSKDKKYYIKNNIDEKFLLRISDFNVYDIKKKEFESMQEVYKLGINMSKPIDFGICNEGKYTYSLLSWIDGQSADEVILNFSYKEQYKLGAEAGKILRKMHSIVAPIGQEDWEKRMINKISNHQIRYEKSGIKVRNDEFAIKYISNNLHLLKNRSQGYQHGDFHIGNLIITPNNTIGVIDFNRWDYGDPVEEFYKMIIFSRELSIPFANGQINGYFENKIPEDFFETLALYVADIILFSIVWVIPFGSDDVDGMIKRAEMVLDDYDNFNSIIPKWFDNKEKYD